MQTDKSDLLQKVNEFKRRLILETLAGIRSCDSDISFRSLFRILFTCLKYLITFLFQNLQENVIFLNFRQFTVCWQYKRSL